MNTPSIASKLPNIGTTIFTVMSTLAAEHQAVNLGQGFPDFNMSEALTDMVNKAMTDGYNQYAPMPGWMPLREAIAEKINLSVPYHCTSRYRNYHYPRRHLCYLYRIHHHTSTW